MYDSMVFYRSFYEAIKGLDAETKAEIYDAIFAYGLDGTESICLSPIASAIFTLVKPQIDANNKRKEAGKENGKKGAQYGKLGGRPKKNNPQETPKKPRTRKTKPSNVNVNANANANANVNANANDNDNDNANVIMYYPLDVKLDTAFKEFIEYRRTIKNPMSDIAIKKAINTLDGMTTDNDEKIMIINQSIVNGWKGLFPLKDNCKKKSNNKVAESLDDFYGMMKDWGAERAGNL